MLTATIMIFIKESSNVIVGKLRALSMLVMLLMPLGGWAMAPDYEDTIMIEQGKYHKHEITFQQALGHILIRVSGNKSILTLGQAKDFIHQAPRHVKSYRYDRHQDGQTLMNIHFDGPFVRRMLRKMGQSIWMQPRERIMIWVLDIDDQGQAVFLENDHPAILAMIQRAQLRGLPVSLPVFDLMHTQLAQKIQADMPMIDWSSLGIASEPYHADMLVLVSIRHEDGHMRITWHWQRTPVVKTWHDQNHQLGSMLANGIDSISDDLAEQHGQIQDTAMAKAMTLVITGIASAQQFQSWQNIMKKDEIIEHYQLRYVLPNRLIYDVDLASDLVALRASLAHQHIQWQGVDHQKQIIDLRWR